jgi:hypothetical protein
MMGRGLIMLNRTLTLILAFAAGLLGGTLSRNGLPTGAFAQAQSTAPKEIRAQRFTLVDETGRMRGVFAIEPLSSPNGLKEKADGDAVITLYDGGGREIFRAGAPSGRLVGQ